MKTHWHKEFAVTPSKDNPYLHDFYREYFGKSPKLRIVPVSPPRKLLALEPPSLSATLQRSTARIPRDSYALSTKARVKEVCWDARFNVKFSKDNPQYPVPVREYFDRPRELLSSCAMRKTSPKLTKTKRKRLKSKASVMSWQLRSTTCTDGWRTSSPVMSSLNSLRHPKMREYFL